jgi:hypothetical protein
VLDAFRCFPRLRGTESFSLLGADHFHARKVGAQPLGITREQRDSKGFCVTTDEEVWQYRDLRSSSGSVLAKCLGGSKESPAGDLLVSQSESLDDIIHKFYGGTSETQFRIHYGVDDKDGRGQPLSNKY